MKDVSAIIKFFSFVLLLFFQFTEVNAQQFYTFPSDSIEEFDENGYAKVIPKSVITNNNSKLIYVRSYNEISKLVNPLVSIVAKVRFGFSWVESESFDHQTFQHHYIIINDGDAVNQIYDTKIFVNNNCYVLGSSTLTFNSLNPGIFFTDDYSYGCQNIGGISTCATCNAVVGAYTFDYNRTINWAVTPVRLRLSD